uniref:CTCK domain-containing protein n=2 Tax=Anolis carolinensis TaxID=28377 RepID=A0A803T8D1_ANOCA
MTSETTPACYPSVSSEYIVYEGCRSEERVPVTKCEGKCATSSIYSAQANSMEHTCSCCRESKTTMKDITLMCPNRQPKKHSYLHVESCECQETDCDASQAAEESQR